MPETPIIPPTSRLLNQFAAKQWDKTLAFLQGQFALSRTDCEDIFQESFIILYEHVRAGKLEHATASLNTYFNAICRNKAFELIRAKGRQLNVIIIDEYPDPVKDVFEADRIDRLLALEDDTDETERLKAAIVREIVRDLPEPCGKLLWGFYRDGFSMRTLSQMYNYKSENSVKVTKHRCCEKFKVRFREMVDHFLD